MPDGSILPRGSVPCLILLILAACRGPAADEETPAAIVPDAPSGAARLDAYDEIGGDFTLTDHRGRAFRLADTHGKVRLLFFGYATCPDVCPLTLSKVVSIRRLLGDDEDEVVALFVSVDPERDTPQKLRAYLRYFDIGEAFALTGARDEIDAVVDLFKATYEIEEGSSATSYLIGHTSHLFLLDREGTVRALFGVYEKPGDIAAAIEALL